MKAPPEIRTSRRSSGLTIVEMLVSSTAFAFVMGSIMSSFVMFNKSFALGRDYAMARLTLSDYLNMDLRRSVDLTPTLVANATRGNFRTNDWTLPLVITVPAYYAADGKSPLAPSRVTLTAAEWEEAKGPGASSRSSACIKSWRI